MSFSQLFGHTHPSFWTAVNGFRRDSALVSKQFLQHDRQQTISKHKQSSHVELQKGLKELCQDFVAERISLEDFLHTVGHCIRLE